MSQPLPLPLPLHILVIEDDVVQANLFCSMLEQTDLSRSMTAEYTTSLRDSIRRIDAGGVDAVLLDLGLPDAECEQSITALRWKYGWLPIIVLTSSPRVGEVDALNAGACDYFPKGDINWEALTKSIRRSVIVRRVWCEMEPIHQGIERTGTAICEAKESLVENPDIREARHRERDLAYARELQKELEIEKKMRGITT